MAIPGQDTERHFIQRFATCSTWDSFHLYII